MRTLIKKHTTIANEIPLHLMLIPGIVVVFIYHYLPMFGVVIAFQKYNPALGFFGSEFVGLKNFIYTINLPGTFIVLRNTLVIASMKIIAMLFVPVTFTLLLNELGNKAVKRSVQTVIYLPHFLSWVILSGILIDILSPSSGIINLVLKSLGVKPIFFLGNNKWFPFVLVATHTWKEFGFGTIIYLAALTSIDPSLYEAAYVDGAGRLKQTFHITIPGILPIVILMTALSLGKILNAGFEQVFNLYSPTVYESGDIIDTLVYRIGLIDAQYGVATAIGLFKSVVSLTMMTISYKLAYVFAGYRIF